MLKFILEGLRVPAIASLAAKAVHNICHKCRNHMAPHFDGLFQICEAADSLKVSNEAVNGLLRGVCVCVRARVLSHTFVSTQEQSRC